MLGRDSPTKRVGGLHNDNYMSDEQMTKYLEDLRSNRAARLNGSRPQPPPAETGRRSLKRDELRANPWSDKSDSPLVPEPLRFNSLPSKGSRSGHLASSSRGIAGSGIGYLENGTRWMEKQESKSLRMALEDMDLEEKRIHEAAQDEASQLVLQHTSPSKKSQTSAFPNPDAPKRDYRIHLRQGSYGKCHAPMLDLLEKSSASPAREPAMANAVAKVPDPDSDAKTSSPSKKKSYAGLANAVAADIANIKRRVSSGSKRKFSSEKRVFPNAEDKIYEEPEPIKEEELVDPVKTEAAQATPGIVTEEDIPRYVRKNPFARVRMNKDNMERANSIAAERPPRLDAVEIQRNPPSQSRRPWYLSNKSASVPAMPTATTTADEAGDTGVKMKDGKEIRNDDIRAATSMKRKDRSSNLPQPTAVSHSPGRPIVSFGDDWKQKEEARARSPAVKSVSLPSTQLPVHREPTGMSSKLESARPGHSSPKRAPPSSHTSPATYVPSGAPCQTPQQACSIPNGIPILNLPDDDDGTTSKVLSEEPEISTAPLLQGGSPPGLAPADLPTSFSGPAFSLKSNVSKLPTRQSSIPEHVPGPRRPLPEPKSGSRGLPQPTPRFSPSSKPHLTPTQVKSSVLCASCALPIAGRILTAAGQRFHPECFACHTCGINLECVAFYPEPDQKHYERIARIQHRMHGLDIVVPPGVTAEDVRRLEEEDGDESLRFFCHLDFHELFSPRCKSCKTPIEGEVVVACGAEWHVGHFFCAQCGDPFDSSMPFVEKEGYAWCLNCHTNRYSPKCRKCRKPVTDLVLNALGYDWHGGCFCCTECGGGFDDGQYFLRGDSSEPATTFTHSRSPTPSHRTPVRSKKPDPDYATTVNNPVLQSAASLPTGGANPRYFTPALFPRSLDYSGRVDPSSSLRRGRSESVTSEDYYTAAWNTPSEPSTAVGPHIFGRAAAGNRPAPLAGFVFGLDHLIPSRLPQSVSGDGDDSLSPTAAKQLRDAQKTTRTTAGLFGERTDFLTEARGVPIEKSLEKPRKEQTMLASRWAPTPERELHEKDSTSVDEKKTSIDPLETPQKISAAQHERQRTSSLETPKESPRKKKKVLWNGRQCIIALPLGGPEKYNRPQPLSLAQVSELMQRWRMLGHNVEGFDVLASDTPESEGDRGTLRYQEAQELHAPSAITRTVVRVPNLKAWKDYENWLMEEKLRALGVGGPDEASVSSRDPSGSQQSRTLSPQLNASVGNPQSFPLSQRSTPGLSNFSTAPHSRTMSIASPLSSGAETRSHSHRHSILGMPQQFQHVPGAGLSMRSFSPSQQLSLNAVARAASPGLERLKGSASPVLQANVNKDGQPLRPSPVGQKRVSPLSHVRHQSLAPAFTPQPSLQGTSTPNRQQLSGVPENEEEQYQYTPRAHIAQSDIHVPTPRGHRHNISESLEKEIRENEAYLEIQERQETQEAQDATSNHKQPATLEPTTAPFKPAQDSFSFQPTQQPPVAPAFQFGAAHTPAFQPQAFAFSNQVPYGQPALTSTQATLKPEAPSFDFNQNNGLRGIFQPGPLSDMFPQVPARPNLSTHTRQISSGNLDVSAPAFKPQGAFNKAAPISSKFDFSSAYKFTPNAPSFLPKTTGGQIFGEVHIPEVVKPARRSKAIAIVRPESSHKEGQLAPEEEDEAGRPTRTADRQKRAFKATEDDGDSIPMFAHRPDSPSRGDKDPARSDSKHSDNALPVEGRAVDENEVKKPVEEVTADKHPDVEEKAATPPLLDYMTDENKENAPIQVSSKAQVTHARNLSSLSALARPFEFNATAQGAARATKLDPETSNFSPARIFSRDTAIKSESPVTFEPEKEPRSALREATPPQLAELSFEPSFDEIDAVMRQLNDDEERKQLDDREAAASEDQGETGEKPVSTVSSPSAIVAELDAVKSIEDSNASVRIHDVRTSRAQSISSLSEGPQLDEETSLEMPSPAMQGPRNRNVGPSSEWSDAFSPTAEDRIRQRSGFFDERVDEVIGKTLKEYIRPLQDEVIALRQSLAKKPSTTDGRARTLPSSGLDSDADDEDDITNTNYLPRPQSSRGGRKYEMMKSALAEVLANRPTSPLKSSYTDLLNGFDTVNSRLDTLLVKGFELDEVREVVEEAILRASSSLVHVPRSESPTNIKDILKRESFDNKKLLRLAEEELDTLRASIADKDVKLDLLKRERRDLRDRAEIAEELADKKQRKIDDLEAESISLHATLDEYRALRMKLKHDHDDLEAENRQLRTTLRDLEEQVADGRNVRDNMRDKLDRIQMDMATAAEQIANQKVNWQRKLEDLQKRCTLSASRLDHEAQLRNGLEGELSRLRILVSEGESAKMQLEQGKNDRVLLEETIQSLRDEVNELQTSNSRVHRELQDARENSRLEVQRAQLMMQAGMETAQNQADAMRAGLESKLSITANELDNMKALMDAMKSRHETLLQEEADLRRDALFKVNEASNSALENLRARHEEDLQFLRNQHARELGERNAEKTHAEHFWNERLTMSEERNSHLKERITHLEERLAIAKSAASAAAQAAQAAAKPPASTSTMPERISPQALRESILVLQEQLQDRENAIERLQTQLNSQGTEHPQKIKEKDIEISWLRELLAVRADDLSELITTLSKDDFDRQSTRDAAIRIQTQMQIEQAEKERHISAGDSLPAQALAGITNFASPKAVQLAAAIGNWRARGAPSAPTPRSVRARPLPKEMKAVPSSSSAGAGRGRMTQSSDEPDTGPDETPSKSNPARPGSAASWMSGLMTPPASGLRRTPSPSSSSSLKPKITVDARPDSKDSQTTQKGFGNAVPASNNEPSTPGYPSLGFGGGDEYDEDAGDVQFDDVEARGLVGRSLAAELEPLG